MPKKIFTQELEGTRRRGRPRKGRKVEVERDLQVLGVRRWRELVADRKKMEGPCSTGQSPQWAVVPMEEGEEHLVNTNHDSLMPFPSVSCHFLLGPTTIPSGSLKTYISTTRFPPQQLSI